MVPLYKQMILVDTLPETNIAPKNEWLEGEFPFWDRLFSVVTMLVSGMVGISIPTQTPCWRCEGDILV